MNYITKTWAPLIGFLCLVIILGWVLPKNRNSSSFILKDTALPQFHLPSLLNPHQYYSNKDIAGEWVIINIWASWCSPCRLEHPVLVNISQQNHLPILGINFRDEYSDAIAWLEEEGNPFTWTLVDYDGKLAFDWGIVGVPTTWLISPEGEIVHQLAGVLTQKIWDEEFMPFIRSEVNDGAN